MPSLQVPVKVAEVDMVARRMDKMASELEELKALLQQRLEAPTTTASATAVSAAEAALPAVPPELSPMEPVHDEDVISTRASENLAVVDAWHGRSASTGGEGDEDPVSGRSSTRSSV